MKTKIFWVLLIFLALICVVSFRSNDVIQFLSLCLAVLSLAKMYKIEKRKLQIEEERRTEEKVASLTACFHYERVTKRRTLRIENNGKGEARNINVLLDDKPLDEQHPLWYKNHQQITTKLSGHKYIDYILHLPASKVPKIAKIHWADDVKENNVNECSLHLV